MERTELIVFRKRLKLKQEEIAEKIGVTRSAYAQIEKGTRDGKKTFWNALQKAFNIPDAEMWGLMRKDGE